MNKPAESSCDGPVLYTTTYYINGVIRKSSFEWPIPSRAKRQSINARSERDTKDEKDFLLEAGGAGVLTPLIKEKIRNWFTRRDVSPGMRNMQCAQLIKNAIKKKLTPKEKDGRSKARPKEKDGRSKARPKEKDGRSKARPKEKDGRSKARPKSRSL